jgi:hypothetical protein
VTVAAGALVSRHGIHILTLAGPMIVITLVAVAADLRAWGRRLGISADSWLMGTAAAMSVGAAAVHVVVCPEHLREAAIYGAFFATAATLQIGWALLALRHRAPWVAAAGAAGNLVAIALWAVTRTVGLPFGPEAGAVERVGILDVVATFYEVGVVVACCWALVRFRRSGAVTSGSEESAAELGVGQREGRLVRRWDGSADEVVELFPTHDASPRRRAGAPAPEGLLRQV